MKNISPIEKNPDSAVKLDAVDLSILRVLQENARATIREVAEKVHLSTTPVYERIKRLETQGVIRQYATLLDAEKVGKGLMVICYVSLKEHNKKAGTKFIQAILALPEVIACYNISGEFDFMLKVVSAHMQDYYHFHVNVLSQIDNVGNLQSVFVMGVIKDTHRLL